MIVIDAGSCDERGFAAKILFAALLESRGHTVGVDEDSIPDTLDRGRKYDAAPFLIRPADHDIAGAIVIGAEAISDETLFALRKYGLSAEATLAVVGRFRNPQMRLSAQSRLAYALGREPQVVDLAELQPRTLDVAAAGPLLTLPPSPAPDRPDTPALFVYLPVEALHDPATLPLLAAMDNMGGFRLNILIAGQGKDQIRNSRYSGLSVFGYDEIPPATLANYADILAFFGDSVPGERMALLALDVMRRGNIVIDCTSTSVFCTGGAPSLRGPAELAALSVYLEHSVLVNRAEVGRDIAASQWVAAHGVDKLEELIGLEADFATTADPDTGGRAIFVPTNGNGLGHAQRCALIAHEIAPIRPVGFLAFPSCVPMLNNKGFSTLPLVQTSTEHSDNYANDIVNYLRYRRTLLDGDHLVFDGGYVFDSIYRTILEKRLGATWVKRGLLRPGQIGATQTDRAKAFSQILIPEEAFDELNSDLHGGERWHRVGPIVQDRTTTEDDRATLRVRLAGALDHDFDELVVTMLGGGIAADRTAQMQALCALCEDRPRLLHLIVAWPGARMPAGLYGWKNTRVTSTHDALSLALASDLAISAVGYNSFHELLYHGVPAIFVPQVAPYMDDQERRARAASERGLAETVMAHELLLLERELTAFLDEGKADELRTRLGAHDFRTRGNKQAATLIERAAS